MHRCFKFGENVLNTQQSARYRVNNVLGRTDGRMDEQDKNSMPPATLRWVEAKKFLDQKGGHPSSK